MPLHPGIRRPPAHLKQSRSSKTKLDADDSNAITATHSSAPQAASGKKGQKRKADTALPDNANAELNNNDTDAADATASGSGKKRGRAQKAATKQSEKSKASKAATATKPKGKGRRRRRKGTTVEDDEADLQLQDDIAAVCAASLSEAQAVPHQNGETSAKAKRLGDIELENQLAMALASTGAEAEHRARHQPRATEVHSQATLPQPSAHAAKPTLGESWMRSSGDMHLVSGCSALALLRL